MSSGNSLRCETRSRKSMSSLPPDPRFQAFVALDGTCRY